MLLKLVRNGLGSLIALGDVLTRPRKMSRSEVGQKEVEKALTSLSLYQFFACPFCIKTRRAMHRLNLNIECRDASNNPQHRKALMDNGGKVKVPCLRIEEENGDVVWLYESGEIINYLDNRFGAVV